MEVERKCFNRYEAAYLMISTKVLLITISGALVTRHLSEKVFAMHPFPSQRTWVDSSALPIPSPLHTSGIEVDSTSSGR